MRFDLDADQADLAAVARQLFADLRPDDQAAVLAGRSERDQKAWGRLSMEAGFPSIAVPSEYDGADGTWLDLALVLEAAGHAASSLPLYATAGAAVAALRVVPEGGPVLAAIAAGEVTATWLDAAAPGIAVGAIGDDQGWTLTGECVHVPHADSVETFVVTARTPAGLGLFRVESGTVLVTPERALDPSRPLASVRLEGAPAACLASEVDQSAIARAQAISRILLAAEQVGVGEGILELAIEHALTRQQFGRPIGGFQAVKHLLADAYAEVDSARVVARYAAWAVSVGDDSRDADPTELAALTAAHVSPAIVRAAAAALQVLGGVGYTWEHPAHLYYKRALSSARSLGAADEHLDRLASGLLATPA